MWKIDANRTRKLSSLTLFKNKRTKQRDVKKIEDSIIYLELIFPSDRNY